MVQIMKKITLTIFICFFSFLIGCAAPDLGIMEIYVFNIEKADAILITTENYTILIDTGERSHGQIIVDELLNRGISKIDTLIITHFHKDHLGGAATIIGTLPINEVIVPNYGKESRHYDRFNTAMNEAGLESNILTEIINFNYDNISFTIYPSLLEYHFYGDNEDESDEGDGDEGDNDDGATAGYETAAGDGATDAPNENNFSLAASINHGNMNFLFTGDARSRRLRELLSIKEVSEIQYDFLKVPHHGRHSGRSIEFINTIRPAYAVITCSSDSPADDRVINALKNIDAKIFFTTEGSVRLISDGRSLNISIGQ